MNNSANIAFHFTCIICLCRFFASQGCWVFRSKIHANKVAGNSQFTIKHFWSFSNKPFVKLPVGIYQIEQVRKPHPFLKSVKKQSSFKVCAHGSRPSLIFTCWLNIGANPGRFAIIPAVNVGSSYWLKRDVGPRPDVSNFAESRALSTYLPTLIQLNYN